MFGLGTTELMVILGIAFMVFGGKRLPEIGSGLGKGIRSFKKGLTDREEDVPVVQELKGLKEGVDTIKNIGNTKR